MIDTECIVILRMRVCLMWGCLTAALTGYAFCTPVANTAPAARGSKNFEKAILYMANGAKSHPCSSAPRWYILVPALPGFAKILRAPNSLHKCIRLQANRRQYLVKHWEDRRS